MDEKRNDACYCERCGNALGTSDPAPLCMQCDTEQAGARLERERAKSTAANAGKSADKEKRLIIIRRVVTGALLVLSVAVILLQAPALLTAVSPPKPLRDGTKDTDATTDTCISNLWIALADATEGRTVRGLTCPASGSTYLVTTVGDATIIACPNPDRHGLSEISASTATRLPVVR
ncbi:MAG: hypothetical protein Q7W30_04900 [Coriobacteriia bacterium]|nr:hypothetical protein [Coriobacteriia bacterium]